jgi:bifunctional enzyme CysN/CysC
VLRQTRRHSFIASLLGIKNIVVAINKIDLVDYSKDVFERIREDYLSFAKDLGFRSIVPIPMSALHGDNVTNRSERMDWYSGPTLLAHLETIDVEEADYERPFRLPVQYVSRPNLNFRGFAGQVASGHISRGDEVVVAKTGTKSRVKRIVTMDGDLETAVEGHAVTLVLEDEIDCSRGDVLVPPTARPAVADQFSCNIVWFDEKPLYPGRPYILRTETQSTGATVTDLKYQMDVNTFAHTAVKSLSLNEVGHCNISTQEPVAFDPYKENRATGSFVLIDRMTNATVAAGMIDYALRRAENIHWQSIDIDRNAHARQKNQTPKVFWFTGLSGSGKSTLANLIEKRLHAEGKHTFILDGDNVRHGLNRDLGFTDADRVENIRRVAEVARLMSDAGLIVLVSFISPFESERQLARQTIKEGEFVEVFVDTPFEECARRDPKGLYRKALSGELKNFTGIDSPYEPPAEPELHLVTAGRTPEQLVEDFFSFLEKREAK